MAMSKVIVACRRCGAQYIKAVDYNGLVLFIEHPETSQSRRLAASACCFTCGTELSSDNITVIRTLFDRSSRGG